MQVGSVSVTALHAERSIECKHFATNKFAKHSQYSDIFDIKVSSDGRPFEADLAGSLVLSLWLADHQRQNGIDLYPYEAQEP